MSSDLANGFALAVKDPIPFAPALPDAESLTGLAILGVLVLAGLFRSIVRGEPRPRSCTSTPSVSSLAADVASTGR